MFSFDSERSTLNSKYTVLGMARSGIAAALKIKELGGDVFISEKRPADLVKSGIDSSSWNSLYGNSEFGGHTDALLDSDVLIVSPGIPLNLPVIQKALQRGVEVISEIEFGFRIKAEDSKIIAVTGSNGKSTTVSMIHQILSESGFNAILAGNIGNSLTSYPLEKPGIDYIVLELSSFQLELVNQFHAERAVILNITPDHLDRYKSFGEYVQAKKNIFNNQTPNDYAVLNSDDPNLTAISKELTANTLHFGSNAGINKLCYDGERIVSTLAGRTQKKVLPAEKLPLPGLHNIYNFMAAVCSLTGIVSEEQALESLRDFQALPHRLERIALINGIVFINDSKATNTESVKQALSAFDKPLHIILGGYEKGEDYSVLNPYLATHAAGIYLIGAATANMAAAFRELNSAGKPPVLYRCKSLKTAVQEAFHNAAEGEIVLLSPACASFDMFADYEQRGNVFKEIVKSLAKTEQDSHHKNIERTEPDSGFSRF